MFARFKLLILGILASLRDGVSKEEAQKYVIAVLKAMQTVSLPPSMRIIVAAAIFVVSNDANWEIIWDLFTPDEDTKHIVSATAERDEDLLKAAFTEATVVA